MQDLNISVPHELDKDEAKSRIAGLLCELKKQYGESIANMKETWHEDSAVFSFHLMGFAVSGHLHVNAAQVSLEGELPFFALPFKSKIEKTIAEKAQTLLSARIRSE